MTRFGVVLPQHDAGAQELIGAAKLAEGEGLDSIWLSDHLWGYIGGRDRPVLEGWTSLAAVAAATETVTVGSLVTRVSIRNPRVLVSMTGNLARISSGRFILGLGVSDSSNREEQKAYGISFNSKARRVELLQEIIELMSAELPEVPIWVGGASDQVLELALSANAWNFWGPVDMFEPKAVRLKEIAAGRRVPETTWAGSYPKKEGIETLIAAGASHVISAVGAKNYVNRIAQLAKDAASLR